MKTSVLQIRLTDEEKETITELAAQSACGSVSEYIRSCAMNKTIKNRFDQMQTLELIKINTDIARLGNLFRLSLKDNNKYSAEQLKRIIDSLESTCDKLKGKVLL